jgi:transcriptional regulator with XRE-family HTH domain
MTPEEFKATRKQMGKTQAEMAADLGVSQEMIAQIESGKKAIPPELLQKLGMGGLFSAETEATAAPPAATQLKPKP